MKFSYVHATSHLPLIYRTVGEQLSIMAQRFPDSTAVISHHQNKIFTYSEFFTKSQQLAASFRALGLQSQSRIGIYSPNNYEWVLTQFAASMADLILVNINPAYQLKELEYALNKVGCEALVMKDSHKKSDYLSMIRELAPEVSHSKPGQLKSKRLPDLKHVIRIESSREAGFYNFDDLFNLADSNHINFIKDLKISPDSITNIQFTSGTTGAPKGAALTHHNIVNNGRYIGLRNNYTEKDSVCIPVPLYHCFGMVLGNMACINYGAAMVYPSEGFVPSAALEAVTKYKCTSLYGVPTMFIEYLKEYKKNQQSYNLSSLRTGIIAGSLTPAPLMKDIIQVLNMKEITNCYGMTETAPVSAQTQKTDSFELQTTTVGQVSPHLEVKIVDEKGELVPIGTPGEYCVRGYSLMKCYWNDPKQTEETLDAGGFLKTGDIAVMNEDGYISITGRKKDLIIRGGENVYPKEIEDHLLGMPGVEMVQVVGCHDDKFGEEIAALIKLQSDKPPLEAKYIFEFCHKQIAHYKVPKYVIFVDDFPYTVTGKPQKFKMKEMVNDKLHLLMKIR